MGNGFIFKKSNNKPSKCDVGNWLFSKYWIFWGNSYILGNFREFFGNSLLNLLGILCGILCELSMIVYIFKSQLASYIFKVFLGIL